MFNLDRQLACKTIPHPYQFMRTYVAMLYTMPYRCTGSRESVATFDWSTALHVQMPGCVALPTSALQTAQILSPILLLQAINDRVEGSQV